MLEAGAALEWKVIFPSRTPAALPPSCRPAHVDIAMQGEEWRDEDKDSYFIELDRKNQCPPEKLVMSADYMQVCTQMPSNSLPSPYDSS